MRNRSLHRSYALILVFAFLLAFYPATESAAKGKQRRTSRTSRTSSRGKASRSRGRAARGRSVRGTSARGRRGRALASGSSRGGRLVPLRDSRGRVKRDRRGRVMYARVAPPKPKPGAEIPTARVTEIQHALSSQGFYKGESTGSYDDSTKAAMAGFQTAHGLKATGYPTAQTLKLLGLTKTTGVNSRATEPPNSRPRTVTKKNP